MKTRSMYAVLALLVILSMVISACAPAPAAPAAEAPAEQAAAAPAGEFNWRAHEGESLKLLLNQ
ncbi:MAG: sugar ABC transporter substrate-binding protein, partial [Caldilineaceae bacterium]|nr:sugar ABC transporter substrate-binding protein [Caldilineaceae bacterium]